jgi:CheY-like chemotaxis protein
LLKRSKTERANRAERRDGSDRVLVVDDHPEAARLLGRILRQAGFEVAELTNAAAVTDNLVDEPRPVGAVVASFTTSGTRASLRLLDSLRGHPDPRIAAQRVLLVSDHSRQQIFCFQAGADGILLRPYRADDLISELRSVLVRPEVDRALYRAGRIAELQATVSHPLDPRAAASARHAAAAGG